MSGSIVRTKNTDLGVKIGTNAVGWTLIKRSRPKRLSEEYGDVLAKAREAAQTMKKEGEPLTVYAYENDEAYASSLAARDGLPRSAHTEMVDFIAEQLASEGFDIVICEVD